MKAKKNLSHFRLEGYNTFSALKIINPKEKIPHPRWMKDLIKHEISVL